MARFLVEVLRVEPLAQARVVNLRLALPEARSQPALNAQMIQFEFDGSDAFGKIAPYIVDAYIET
jgi:hypothetical protein